MFSISDVCFPGSQDSQHVVDRVVVPVAAAEVRATSTLKKKTICTARR